MDEREIAKIAALYATGSIADDALLEALGGDDSLFNEVVAMSGAAVVTGAVAETVSDVVDATFDVVEDLNPFNW